MQFSEITAHLWAAITAYGAWRYCNRIWTCTLAFCGMSYNAASYSCIHFDGAMSQASLSIAGLPECVVPAFVQTIIIIRDASRLKSFCQEFSASLCHTILCDCITNILDLICRWKQVKIGPNFRHPVEYIAEAMFIGPTTGRQSPIRLHWSRLFWFAHGKCWQRI